MSPIPRRRGIVAAGVLALALPAATLAPVAAAAAPVDDPVAVIIEFDAPGVTSLMGAERIAEARRAAGEVGTPSVFAAQYAAAADAVTAAQVDLLSALYAAGIPVDETDRVTGLINAVVGTVPAGLLDDLAAADGVAHVTPDRRVHALTTDSVPSTGAPAAWDRTDAAGTPLRGAGVTVAIIDTGIDYAIADLGGGFGDGFRVVDGYDFVNDDADPMDDHYHGTHVAGIVAGSGAESVTGMAPEASLTAYKVLNHKGQGDLSDVLLGLEAAADPTGAHPADVVNFSLGGAGDGTDPLARAAAEAVESGTVVVAAAGNEGPGPQTVGTPAAADGVIAVGATTTGLREPTIEFHGATRPPQHVWRFALSGNPAAGPVTARIVDVGSGTTPEDYDAAGDVTGAIVAYQGSTVKSLGTITSYDIFQAELAEQHGAAGVLVYQPTDADPTRSGEEAPQFEAEATAAGGPDLAATGWDIRRSIPMLGTYAGDYLAMREEVLAGSVTATIGSVDATDAIASFSSRGPSARLGLKPEIVAPGVEVRSSVPIWQEIDGNSYRLSGTSMAAPHVAGAAALIRQAFPAESALDVRARLIGSARPLASDIPSSPLVQGAGALAVDRAVATTVTASPDVLSLGVAATAGKDRSVSATLTLMNHSASPVRLTLDLEESGASHGDAKLSSKKVTIPADGSTEVRVTVTPEQQRQQQPTDGEVSGVVTAKGDGATLRVPYTLLVRPLVVQSTPDVADAGTRTRVIVRSAALLEDPELTVVAPSGTRSTVRLEPDTGDSDWYAAPVDLSEIGRYSLEAVGSIDGRLVTGVGEAVAIDAEQVGAWEQVGPNNGGTRLAVSPGSPDTAMQYATDGVHPFVTHDRGDTWMRVRSVPVADGWSMPVADETRPGAFWVAVNGMAGKQILDPTYQGQVLYTPDAGESWDVLPFPDRAIIAFDVSGDTLAALTATGVELSRDRGATWTLLPAVWPSPDLSTLAFAGKDLVVQTDDGVWRLADAPGGGSDFEAALEPGEEVTFLGSDAEDDAVVVLSHDNGAGVVWRSLDRGATWERAGTPEDGYVSFVRIVNGSTYLRTPNGLQVSDDYGVTSTPVDLPLTDALVSDVDFWPGDEDTMLLTIESAGLYEHEAGQWRRVGVSGDTPSDLEVGVDADGEAVLRAATDEGVQVRSLADLAPGSGQEWGSTGNEGWIGVGATDVEQSTVGARDVWTIPQIGSIQRAALDGTKTAVGPAFTDVWGLRLSPLEENTVAVQYNATPETGILVSTDGFDTWQSHPYDFVVRDLAFDPAQPKRLWIAADDGLYRSDDLGQTVTRVADTLARSVFIDPADPEHIVVGTDGGALVSTDGGRKFSKATMPAFAGPVLSVVAVESKTPKRGDPGLLVAGSWQRNNNGLPANGAGAFVSDDGGRTWQPASGGLTTLSIQSLVVSPDGGWVYAAAHEGGVVRTQVSTLLPEG